MDDTSKDIVIEYLIDRLTDAEGLGESICILKNRCLLSVDNLLELGFEIDDINNALDLGDDYD